MEWFLIIAPEFSENAEIHSEQLEMQVGKDIRLLRAADLKQLAERWRDNYATDERELPLSVFYGSGLFSPEVAAEVLDRQFS